MSRSGIASLYSIFAAIAIGVNIFAQWLSLKIYAGECAIQISVIFGTTVGLASKYVLDKMYIFRYRTDGGLHELRVFAAYTVMGLLTTSIFWGAEWLFHVVFGSARMRLIGGALGLAFGYYVKYKLDAKYVFSGAREMSAPPPA